MTSPPIFGPQTTSRHRSPMLPSPFRTSPRRSPSEYQLHDLEPRPMDTESVDSKPAFRQTSHVTSMDSLPPDFEDYGTSSPESSARPGSRTLFSGPPPPIASSKILGQGSSSSSSSRRSSRRGGPISPAETRPLNGGGFFDMRQREISHRPDSIWRGMQRQEKGIEREIQQLLDLQASGLLAGSGGGLGPLRVDDNLSSMESSIFYSTATSQSQMVNSLHIPMRSTLDGNVIPVRQPSKKPLGLRSVRTGIKRSMSALAELKAEEDVHVETAIAQRKEALVYLKKMSKKRNNIYRELRTLEDNEQEPLGQELRGLGAQDDELTQEIKAMEEKLMGMRNRRRWLREKMDDVKNRREAGLSGYKAAGRDIDAEVHELMRRPPVEPLDLDALNYTVADQNDAPGGMEFLRLRPERRTVEMAQAWWESEIKILEQRKAQILDDRQALEEGSTLWNEVITKVAEFESSLRGVVNAGSVVESKGSPEPEVTIQAQLERMDSVVKELEERLHIAEEKHWNLLICAIGAELEAFVKAQSILEATVKAATGGSRPASPDSSDTERGRDVKSSEEQQDHDESDNEVPLDLLVSRVEQSDGAERRLVERRDSESSVPPGFLTELPRMKERV